MQFRRAKKCYFTANGVNEIDYKDIDLLKKFVTESGRIVPSRITGTRACYQRRLEKSNQASTLFSVAAFLRSSLTTYNWKSYGCHKAFR